MRFTESITGKVVFFMSDWPQVAYEYDGTFAGFLTCVYQSYANRETPAAFFSPEDDRISLYPARQVQTDQRRAKQIYRELRVRISPEGQRLASYGFLTCMPERELAIYHFIHLGYQIGTGVTRWLTDDRVGPLYQAVQYLTNEAHLLKGFIRFADYGQFLASEIEPKNRVLPLLRPHFCARYNTESFLIYDKTHMEVLFYQPEQWKIVPVTGLELPHTSQRERVWQALWKNFYDTIAIEGRYNPKLRMNNVPKRYWANMTELKGELAREKGQNLPE